MGTVPLVFGYHHGFLLPILGYEGQVEKSIVKYLKVSHFLGGGLLKFNFDLLVRSTALLGVKVAYRFDKADLVVQTGWADDLWGGARSGLPDSVGVSGSLLSIAIFEFLFQFDTVDER